VREQVKGWLDDLQDWCITRDAPYFGFPVDDPEFPDKFLYVWVDAPIGYLSSAEHYFAEEAPADRRLAPAEFEARYLRPESNARLEHFIGKDILRFHAVFWPAMLEATGLRTPDRMAVHGHLTVNGEKMSKSRGTFITARTYLDAGLDPELLRYYYAAMLGPGIADLDLSLDEFRNRVNADLANNVANLASRVASLLQRSDGPVLRPPDSEIALAAREAIQAARSAYLALELRQVVRAVNAVADLCNRRIQAAKPWEAPTSEAAQTLLYSVAKALEGLALALGPVMPRFAGGLGRAFGRDDLGRWTEAYDPYDGAPVRVREKPPQIARLEARQVEKLVILSGGPAAPQTPARSGRDLTGPSRRSPQPLSEAPSPAETATKASVKPASKGAPGAPGAAAGSLDGVIQYDDFAKVELKVAVVKAAKSVPKADKLLELSVDVGEPEPRTIVAGIAQAYPDPSALVGRRIVVVANLAPRPLRGITSHGMLLAAGEVPNLQLVTVGEGIAPGTRVK
jgi:methionyl-tRNA synthetase